MGYLCSKKGSLYDDKNILISSRSFCCFIFLSLRSQTKAKEKEREREREREREEQIFVPRWVSLLFLFAVRWWRQRFTRQHRVERLTDFNNSLMRESTMWMKEVMKRIMKGFDFRETVLILFPSHLHSVDCVRWITDGMACDVMWCEMIFVCVCTNCVDRLLSTMQHAKDTVNVSVDWSQRMQMSTQKRPVKQRGDTTEKLRDEEKREKRERDHTCDERDMSNKW